MDFCVHPPIPPSPSPNAEHFWFVFSSSFLHFIIWCAKQWVIIADLGDTLANVSLPCQEGFPLFGLGFSLAFVLPDCVF